MTCEGFQSRTTLTVCKHLPLFVSNTKSASHTQILFRHNCIPVVLYNINKLAFGVLFESVNSFRTEFTILKENILNIHGKNNFPPSCFLLSRFFSLKKHEKCWVNIKCSPGAFLFLFFSLLNLLT